MICNQWITMKWSTKKHKHFSQTTLLIKRNWFSTYVIQNHHHLLLQLHKRQLWSIKSENRIVLAYFLSLFYCFFLINKNWISSGNLSLKNWTHFKFNGKLTTNDELQCSVCLYMENTVCLSLVPCIFTRIACINKMTFISNLIYYFSSSICWNYSSWIFSFPFLLCCEIKMFILNQWKWLLWRLIEQVQIQETNQYALAITYLDMLFIRWPDRLTLS